MSSSKKKNPREVDKSKIAKVLEEREKVKKTTKRKVEDLPDGIHEIKDITREEGMRRIEEIFLLDAYNSYGLSEMNGPGVAFECKEKQEMLCSK